MNENFAAIILGGTGQVGGAAVAELLAIPECREVVMVTRKPTAPRSRMRNEVLDTSAPDFADRTAALAREVLSQGPVSAVSCVGVGSGSMRWTEEELQRLEVGVVGAFARGCHDAGIAQFCLLSAAGSSARSRFRYVRVMGMKEDTVRGIGFARLAIFRPGIIVGNAHTPAWVAWLGRLVPGSFGNIEQQILGRSIAAEIALHSREAGEVVRENAAMKNLTAQLHRVA
ncbi:MAG: NAD-dependent epimerase/dehydratase family protein [Acidobacteriaceae bacterium]